MQMSLFVSDVTALTIKYNSLLKDWALEQLNGETIV